MNENIDLTELLNGYPTGTKLYSKAFGTVTFDCIKSDKICIRDHKGIKIYYTKSAKYYYAEEDAVIDLFPSKDQRDWSKWRRLFVPGDVVIYNDDQFAIFEKYIKYPEDDGLIRYYVYYDAENDDLDTEGGQAYVKRLATEEEKQKLFKAIQENGYKWNAETKTLEKLKKEKFDPKTLQSFDKVLVSCNDEWFCDFFSHYDDAVVKFNCICTGGCPYEYCIPYNDDTKHLTGKSIEEAPEFYRYWEE